MLVPAVGIASQGLKARDLIFLQESSVGLGPSDESSVLGVDLADVGGLVSGPRLPSSLLSEDREGLFNIHCRSCSSAVKFDGT